MKAALTRPQVRDSGTFWTLTAILFLVYLSVGLWSPLISVHIQSLGASTRDIGIVLGTFQGAVLLSQYWWGYRSDRLGRRKPLLLWGTAGLALAFVGLATITQWQWVIAVRAFEGIAYAAYTTGSLALVGDVLEDQCGRGRLMGLYRTFGSLAFALAALGGGWLADLQGTHVPLLLAALCYGTAFVLSLRVRERLAGAGEIKQDQAQAVSSDVKTAAPPDAPERQPLWPLLTMSFMWTFGMGAVVYLWPVYMQSVGYSKTAVGGLWALAALGEVPCFVLAGYLADRWGRKRVLLTGFLCMAGVFLGYTISTQLVWLIAVQVLRSLAYACFEAPALLYATELRLRGSRGRLASLYYSSNAAGGITGSVVGGAVAYEVGLAAMYRGVVGLMVLSAIVAGRALPRLRTVVTEDEDTKVGREAVVEHN